MRNPIAIVAVLLAAAVLGPAVTTHAKQDRPNILWIVVEDMSTHFSCYGETTIKTPNVDRLASQGVKFNKAFVTCPVCSPSRSAMVTGMYQTTIGAHNHRSGRGPLKIELPSNVRLIPDMFKSAGYYTANGGKRGRGNSRIGKTDYNFEWDADAYDGADWSGRKPGQPFFAQIQLRGGKLRGKGDSDRWPQTVIETLGSRTQPRDVKLPPYYPRDPVILEDWAQYLDAVRYTDYEVGEILQQLEDEGIADDTVVFFWTDHGISHARGKQFLYEEGIHVPLIARWPDQLPSGTQRDDLVLQIDVSATSLALAGIDVPDYMEGRPLFGAGARPRDYIVAARDRCDETVEHIRCVRTDRFKYIRNYYPDRPHLQVNRYKDAKPIIEAIKRLDAAGKLNEVQSMITAPTRPAEELYDLHADPWEINNLADDPAHRKTLAKMRQTLESWIAETGDKGQYPESEAMYDSDMSAYLGKDPETLLHNIRLMKLWASEGK